MLIVANNWRSSTVNCLRYVSPLKHLVLPKTNKSDAENKEQIVRKISFKRHIFILRYNKFTLIAAKTFFANSAITKLYYIVLNFANLDFINIIIAVFHFEIRVLNFKETTVFTRNHLSEKQINIKSRPTNGKHDSPAFSKHKTNYKPFNSSILSREIVGIAYN